MLKFRVFGGRGVGADCGFVDAYFIRPTHAMNSSNNISIVLE